MKLTAICLAMLLLVPTPVMAQDPGDWVLGRWQGGQYWFPGVVQSRSGKNVTIIYDDGTRETLSTDRVRPYNWTLGSRVECRWAGGSDWYGGKITGISKDGTQLDIHYDDGDRERIATGGCRSS
ncbi:hypothetical protein [Dokdonella sp.]|uniref:tudor domain-containing protein n=1 Tax=Dokdonella sp. TaxID=2291710 RepID=UPI003527D18A